MNEAHRQSFVVVDAPLVGAGAAQSCGTTGTLLERPLSAEHMTVVVDLILYFEIYIYILTKTSIISIKSYKH